ncbi:MAG: Mor transcription activator family protein [Thermodesulfovibrionales bacterium]|nr:Mor transcription activator family protein [Thermodesulfovibrionales bacterium]
MGRRSDNQVFVKSLFTRLIGEYGSETGERLVRLIAEELGGLTVYIPSVRHLERETVRAEVRRLFRGDNHRELAIRFGISEASVRRILKERR